MLGWLASVDMVLIMGSWLLGGGSWLVNTQIAFFSTLLVLGASMLSYSQMVYGRLESGLAVPGDTRDVIEKIEDPYDLYTEEESQDDTETLKKTIREEKQRMKQQRRSIMQVLRDSKASFSLMRLGAYLLLFVGFLYLSKNHLLHIPSYLLGLAFPIVTILLLLLTAKEGIHEAGV